MALAVSLIILASMSHITARTAPPQQPPRPPGPHGPNNSVELVLTYKFSAPGRTERVRFVVLLPKTISGRQKISTTCSPKPSKIFNENGNRYAEFIFEKPKKSFSATVKIQAELSRYDLATAREKGKKAQTGDDDLEQFLRHETRIEKDDEQIQQIAKTITAHDETAIVKQIYDYVCDNMEYGGFEEKDLGALEAIKNKKGDCSEYTALFAAICRAKEIPARVVYGYTSDYVDTPKHAWVEAYLPEYGWVPFDPTRGDQNNRFIRDRLFHTLEPIYLYLANIHERQVVGRGNYYKFWYWGDEIKVKDTVEFKQSAPPARNSR
ncbi:MAG TPA: transglutaminase domain-containing protein [Sedimentisphaerales bacterium]|nr:transglutaminase domain-containing protein [Sedimentisphaerales bacterium]